MRNDVLAFGDAKAADVKIIHHNIWLSISFSQRELRYKHTSQNCHLKRIIQGVRERFSRV